MSAGLDLEEIRKTLEQQRAELLEGLEQMDDDWQAEESMNPDITTRAQLYDVQQRHSAMEHRFEDQIDQIDAALRRIDQGTYGKCLNCGRDIHPERLKIMPATPLCVDCQGKLERETGER